VFLCTPPDELLNLLRTSLKDSLTCPLFAIMATALLPKDWQAIDGIDRLKVVGVKVVGQFKAIDSSGCLDMG
jgi:hypothetical protein